MPTFSEALNTYLDLRDELKETRAVRGPRWVNQSGLLNKVKEAATVLDELVANMGVADAQAVQNVVGNEARPGDGGQGQAA